MPQITFTVYGKPQHQGSIKAVPTKRGMRLTSDNAKLKGWRQNAGWMALQAIAAAGHESPMIGAHVPVEVTLEFMFVRPKSVSASREWPTVKPDIDKLERALLDALTGIAYADDAQVVRVMKEKVYGPVEQVHVSVGSLNQTKRRTP